MTPLRVAIVGSGIIGHNHAIAILRDPRLQIVALVDPVADANARLAEQLSLNAAGFATLEAALAGGDIDIVVITSPSGTHTPLAEVALAAGAHVIIEKPLDASLAAGRRLTELANAAAARGQVCSVISQHRFDPASVAVAQAVASGGFGRITSAVASVAWWRGQDYYDSAGWRGTWTQDGGGATFNQGVHTVDLLLWFLGRPVEVFAHTGVLAHERIEVEDVAVATVRFESGALAVLHATTAAYPGLSVRLQVHGSRGSAIIDDDQLEFYLDSSGRSAADVVPAEDLKGAAKPADNFVVGHLRQIRDVVDAIVDGRAPAVRADDAMLALATVKAVYISAHLHAPVQIDAVINGEFDAVLAALEKP
jgi:UDP-N-acetyl-2-amino-2-deoxyglucuronate dehydrogenase